jgi:hypothetical protein
MVDNLHRLIGVEAYLPKLPKKIFVYKSVYQVFKKITTGLVIKLIFLEKFMRIFIILKIMYTKILNILNLRTIEIF